MAWPVRPALPFTICCVTVRIPRGTDAYGSFALVGCTVAPGFEFSEFELADIETLLSAYPQHETLARRLASNDTAKA